MNSRHPFTSWEALAESLVAAAFRLYQRNMLASCDGNLSLKLDEDTILITPSGKPKAYLSPEDMAGLHVSGETLWGHPSGEKSIHLEIYRRCPKARAVIHAHPPYAIAWSIAHPELSELPATGMSEVILAMGSIPIVPYARPTTNDMGSALRPYLPESRAMILARHGGLTWGESLEEALNAMERLEHSSQILAYAKQLGGLTHLPAEEIAALKKMRRDFGDRIL